MCGYDERGYFAAGNETVSRIREEEQAKKKGSNECII